jgi:hypothetical protein
MRYTDLVLEDPALKKEIIAVVKSTDDPSVLQKVLRTLKAGNIEERIKSVLGKDADASVFLSKIARSIIDIDAPIEEKDAFLELVKNGNGIDVGKLLDGSLHSFDDVIGTGFGKELFKDLSTELTAQGVGPCEVALAVLHPNIAWSGRIKGGGDIIVNKMPVEVKARAAKGGRWINARKANLDLTGIRSAIANSAGRLVKIGDRVGLDNWVNTLRPRINPKNLKTVCKAIADGTFNHVPNSEYQKALMDGDENAILRAIAKVGYNNYKKYSQFEGMLIMDLPTEQVQYFKDFDDMEGQISVKTAYILAPEAEMMPQVELAPGASIRAGRFDVAKSLPQTGQKLSKQKIITIAQAAAKEMAYERGVSDPQSIANITNLIAQEYAKGTDPAKIGKMVYKMFPKTKKPEPTAPAPAKPAQPAPAIAPSAQTAATPAPSAQRPVFPRAR